MKAILLFTLFFAFLVTAVAQSETPQSGAEAQTSEEKIDLRGSFCALDESGEMSVFYCKDNQGNPIHKEEMLPILVNDARHRLEEGGVEIVSLEEFAARVSPDELMALAQGPNRGVNACFQKIYYRVDQFNRLPENHEIADQLRTLAAALHEAGVCDLPVQRQNFNNINIQNSQDVLHHFLCISNSESVFGTRNIGMGGRGPWGIHPAHNQRAGTTAFLDGRTTTLRRNGVCYPSQAIVRDSNGREIKESNRYRNYDVIVDNAKCAMTLYRDRGFRDWGTTSAWGSNRHCSKNTRDRLQFFKHIGPLGCCTAACRARFND